MKTCTPFFSDSAPNVVPPRVVIIEDYAHDLIYDEGEGDVCQELERQTLGGGEFFKLFPRAENKFASKTPEGIESAFLASIDQAALTSATDHFPAIFQQFELLDGSAVRDLAHVTAAVECWQEMLTDILRKEQPVASDMWDDYDY